MNSISRTGERVLGIIGIVFNVLVIILAAIAITSLSGFEGSQEHQQVEQELLNDPVFTNPEEAQMAVDFFNSFMAGFGLIGWVFTGLLVISTIFAVLAIVNLKGNRNAKLAGLFFILAGLFAWILTPTSILFYIAAIMCFVRKAPMQDDELLRKETDVYSGNDTPYRPL